MEESILDYAAQTSNDLLELLAPLPTEEHDSHILQHIKKLTEDTSVTNVFDPNEKGEWVSGPPDETLATYCAGRVALLDFFTYCCINCQHVLPYLRDLEDLYSIQDGLVVVGVHSAKFDAERLSSNVMHAINRLNVKHPVLNDPEAYLWNRLGIHCWPTLVLISPKGKPILVLAGEGHRDVLFRVVSIALNYYKEIGTLNYGVNTDIKFKINAQQNLTGLHFPGKVTLNPFSNYKAGEPWLTISDSGNNRIILADYFSNVTHIIGGLDAKLTDGDFQEARFDNPQGVCWFDDDILIVCDTGNHVLRRICLSKKTVEILAGTGVQAEFGDQGGLKFCQQSLASPWDILLYKTADMDMSIRKPLFVPESEKEVLDDLVAEVESLRRVLLVASAGSHQIWAVYMDTTVWWKYKTYTEGTVLAIVGSGREENRNNRYPNSASLAQPSGLALNGESVYIADSESSSIRHLDLKTGQLSPLAGADRNPSNLFAYGDVDGRGYTARLQHPLGVAYCSITSKVFVADTYNHKIKVIDPTNLECSTFFPKSNSVNKLCEPGGLCMSPKMKSIIVADTNNHRIVMIDQETKHCKVIQLLFPNQGKPKIEKVENYKNNLFLCQSALKIFHDDKAKIMLNINCDTERGEKGLHLTPEAPQRWNVLILNESSDADVTNEWEVVGGVRSGKELPGLFEAIKKVNYPDTLKRIIRIEFFISLCEEGLCFIKRFAVDCNLVSANDVNQSQTYNLVAKMSPGGDVKVSCKEIKA